MLDQHTEHPISSEMSVMRLSLWTGLLHSVAYNQNRQQSRVRLFETGLRFVPDASAENGVRQNNMLAGVICGNQNEEHWNMEVLRYSSLSNMVYKYCTG